MHLAFWLWQICTGMTSKLIQKLLCCLHLCILYMVGSWDMTVASCWFWHLKLVKISWYLCSHMILMLIPSLYYCFLVFIFIFYDCVKSRSRKCNYMYTKVTEEEILKNQHIRGFFFSQIISLQNLLSPTLVGTCSVSMELFWLSSPQGILKLTKIIPC